jgi:putative oxidoreductase
MTLGLLVLRAIVGLLLVGHGAQKLFGVWGGSGLEGTGGFFQQLRLHPGRPMAFMAGASELGGGLLIALGLLTPVGALLITATMVTAIATVHFAKGIWSTAGGYEYNLVLIAVVFALSAIGAGNWSLDHALGLSMAGDGWAIGELALAIAGGLGAVAVGRTLHAREQSHRRGGAHPTAA